MILFSDLKYSDLIPGEIYQAGDSNNYLANEPLSKIFQFDNNLKGLGNQGGIRRSLIQSNSKLKNEEAFIVLLNKTTDVDWQNHYNPSTNILTYYGDNKNPNKHFLDTKQKGNENLKKYFSRAYSKNSSNHIAPFFYFEKEKENNNLKYIGLAIPYVENLEFNDALALKTFTSSDGAYQNFQATFTIVESRIPRQWLYDLKIGKSVSENAPNEWFSFLSNRKIPLKNPILDQNIEESKEEYEIKNPDNIGFRFTSYRKTQTQFRNKLLSKHSKCQLCELELKTLLVASHILPWAISNDAEKIDSNNGLLLCVLHDSLFDKGLISFDVNGKILISKTIPENFYSHLNISKDMKIELHYNQEKYMLSHRASLK